MNSALLHFHSSSNFTYHANFREMKKGLTSSFVRDVMKNIACAEKEKRLKLGEARVVPCLCNW